MVYFFLGELVYFVSDYISQSVLRTTTFLLSIFEIANYLASRYFGLISFNTGCTDYTWSTTFLVFVVSQIDQSKIARLFVKTQIIGDLTYSVFLWYIPIQIIKLVQVWYPIDKSLDYNKLFLFSSSL